MLYGSEVLGFKKTQREKMKISWLQFPVLLDFIFQQERNRLLNWLPVFVAMGIAIYFSLPYEPNTFLLSGICFSIWAAILFIYFRGVINTRIWFALISLALISSGVVLAGVRTAAIEAPILKYEIGPRFIEGRIISIEPSSPGQRYLLGDLSNQGFHNQPIPKFVRLRSNIRQEGIDVGEVIRARVVLKPPSQPALPLGFNFARYAYFRQIGAVGYIWGRVENLGHDNLGQDKEHLQNVGIFWSKTRNEIVRKVEHHLEGDERDLAITFLTGQKGSISRRTKDNIRKSGLAHLLAISGLHMGLVAGIIFFSLRFCMALIPAVALRYPIKKIAALLTLLICFCYLELIAMPLSAQRAYMMAGVSLFAIMCDRQAISMRTVSVAALVLLILTPEVLISASFQLSFAAVIGLVAVFEYYDRRDPGRSFLERAFTGLKVTVICSLVASLATAPFVLYHFHTLPLYGILANLFAVPFTAMVLMPLVLLSYLLIPFGLEGLSLIPLGWAFEFLLWLAELVASIPEGQLKVSAFPVEYLALISVGGLWLCLFNGKPRLLGLIPIVIFVGMVGITKREPDILIDGKAGLIAIKKGDDLFINQTRRARFTSGVWQRSLAAISINNWHDLPQNTLRCDQSACLFTLKGKTVSFVKNGTAFKEDCLKADYIITTLKSPRWCRGKGNLVIDYWDLRKEGAHSVTMSLGGPELSTVMEGAGQRPWTKFRK